MTVDDLKELFEDFSSSGYGECEVRLAHQPHYPFEYHIDGVKLWETNAIEANKAKKQLATENDKEAREALWGHIDTLENENETIVYIREGSQMGYCSRDIWDD